MKITVGMMQLRMINIDTWWGTQIGSRQMRASIQGKLQDSSGNGVGLRMHLPAYLNMDVVTNSSPIKVMIIKRYPAQVDQDMLR